MKLTQRVLESLTCPPGQKDMLVSDDDQKGHFIRVGKSARKGSLAGKSSVVQYQKDGKTRRVFVGSSSAISLAAAREATKAILGDVAKGRDPAAERKAAALDAKREAARDELTLEMLLDEWETLHLAGKRERYRAEAVRAVHVAFEKRLPLPAADLDRAAVVRILDRLAKEGKTAMASRTAAYGRACYQWAIKRGSLAVNPFANLPTTPVAKRERVLSDDELVAIWRACEKPGPFHAIVRMLILSGQRRDEVGAMTWDEVDADLSTWVIPSARAKKAAGHLVPLSREAQALLRVQPRLTNSDLVFPGERGIFSGWSKAKAALDRECGVTGWRLHDLRRTMATGLQRLGVRLEVTEAVLGHIAGSRAGIVGIYQRHSWAEEKRRALELWGAHVAALVEGRESQANVTSIRARASAV
jgi:integrase